MTPNHASLDREDESVRLTEQQFVSALSAALATAYRRAGGIAKIIRSTNGAMLIRNIAALEAAAIYRTTSNAEHPASAIAEVWQPIETAPKDGSSFLGAVPYEDGSWRVDRTRYVQNLTNEGGHFASIGTELMQGLGYVRAHQPTDWMPLPAPPAIRKELSQ